MGNEIDRLEIAIEAEASKANRSLSSMEKHLDKVAEGLEKVLLLANGGLSLDKMFKGVSSANTAEKLGQQMADSLIKGFNLNRAGADVKRQVKSLSTEISKSLYSSGPNNKTTHDIERLGGIVKRHGTIAQEVSADYKNLYDSIKAVSKIKIRPETASALGDNFKSRSGLLRKKMSTKSGIELDSIYQELRGKYPHILPDYSNVEDQFYALNNAVKEYMSLKEKAFRPVTEDEAYEAVADSAGDLNNKLKEVKATSDMVNSSMREMKSLSESFSFDASGMNEMKKMINSAMGGGKRKNTAPRLKRADLKYTATSLDDIFEKYKDVGTGIDLSGVGLPELERMARNAENSVKNLNDRLEKKIAIEGTERLGKTWESLIYDIQKATNEANIYKNKINEIRDSGSSAIKIYREKPTETDNERVKSPKINGAIFSKKEANEIKAVGNELNGVSEDAKRAIVNVSRLQSLVSSLKKSGYTIRAYPPKISSLDGNRSSFARDILDSFKLDENGQLSNLKNLGNVFKTHMSGISKSIQDGFKLNENGTINGVESAKRALSSFVSTAKNAFSSVREVSLNSQLLNATEVVDWDRVLGLESLDKNIRRVENEIAKVKNRINENFISKGKKYDFDEDILELRTLEKELKNLKQIRKSVYSDSDGLDTIPKHLKNATKEGLKLSKVLEGIRKATKKINKAKSDVDSFRKALVNCKKAVSAMFHPLRTLSGLFSESGRSANKGMSLGRMLGSSVLFSYVFQLISAVQRAIVEGSNNLVQYSAVYNKSISSMLTSLTYLKNAWAAAFAPIVNVVAPYVSAFIDMLAGALNAVGQFMAALTGKGFAVQAKKVWQDYGSTLVDAGSGAGKVGDDAKKAASGIGDVGDAAKKATKDLKSYTLGIDELNVIEPDLGVDTGGSGGGTGGSGSPGGGSGGSGSGITGASPTDMFEIVEIDSSIKKLVDMFKEAVKTGDFTEIGQLISDKLSGAMESIDWNSVYKKAEKFGTGLATFLNGLINPRLFRNLGKTVANSINTVFSGANAFAKNFDWKNLGVSVANGIDSFFENWDAGLTAETFSNFAKGFLEAITAAIETLGEEDTFSDIGQKVVDFLCGVDWAGLAWDLTGLFNAFGDAFVEFPMDFAKGFATSLVENLFGEDLSAEVKEKASTIFAPLETIWKNLFSGLSPVANAANVISLVQDTIESGGENIKKFFQSLWKSIQTIFSPVGTWFSEKFKAAKDGVINAWRFVSSWFSENVASPIKSTIDRLKDSIKTAFKTAYEGAVGAWDGISSKFKSIANSAIKPIGSLVNGIIDGVNWVSNKLGAGNVLNNWSVPRFARGSGGISRDTLGMVNDQSGGTYKELIVPPHGKPFIPEGRNVVLPLQRGTKIMPAGQTKAVMNNMPKFAGGIGDFFGNAWSAIRSFTGNVLDYITHPEDIVKIAIDKFTDMSKMFEPWTTIGAGIVNKLFDIIVKKIKYLFDKFSPAGVEKAIKWAVGIANDDSHGYDQASRWGNPDYDCSSLVISAFEQAGIKLKSAGATYTGNMYNAAKSAGFTDVTASTNKATTAGMKRGDILLNRKHHTALYLGNGQIVQASSNEFGKATGGKPGDQTGREISVRSYYNYPWDDILRYVGKAYKEGVGKIGFFDIFRIPQLADGGIMSRGQIFMARENGPELVGRQGNKSVVMNNNQIVQSVSTGVGNAVDSAITRLEARLQRLEEIEEAILEKDMTVNMDGKRVDKQLAKARKNTGYNFSPSPA